MKVSELIEKLKQADGNKEISIKVNHNIDKDDILIAENCIDGKITLVQSVDIALGLSKGDNNND